VVKTAAGFDVPKFLVGSVGRFGVLGELTFKVFPRPPAERTVRLPVAGPGEATRILIELASSRWEPEALDVAPGEEAVLVRLAAPLAAAEAIAREIASRRGGTILEPAAADALWAGLREFRWAHPGGVLLKVALAPLQLPQLEAALGPGSRLHVTAGGNAAFASLADAGDAARVDKALAELGLPAMTLRGDAPLWMGARPRSDLAGAVKQALDAENRFPALDS
jgi:glycolate oxidase FAD binding subunit